MPLSDSAIRTAKPREKLYRLADANGLCLEVTPTGSKLWRYRFNGNAKMLALGVYPVVTPQKARQLRDAARQLLAEGKDPSAEPKAEQEAQQSDGLTFETLAWEWHAYRAPRWAKSTANKTAAYLESDLLSALEQLIGESDHPTPSWRSCCKKLRIGARNVAKKACQWPCLPASNVGVKVSGTPCHTAITLINPEKVKGL